MITKSYLYELYEYSCYLYFPDIRYLPFKFEEKVQERKF